jgi:predicted outer membrane protein
MNMKSTTALLALVSALSIPNLASAASQNAMTLLNGANQMNYEQQDAATLLRSKAGDNQAMITMADTMTGDFKANQEAVKALADSRKITLNTYKKDTAANDEMSKLNGGAFNAAFFARSVRDQKGAIETFKTASRNFRNDRDMQLYIGQTLPILKANLEMTENLQRHAASGSSENPANNRTSMK